MLDDEHHSGLDQTTSSPGPQMGLQATLAFNMDGLTYEHYFKKLDEMAELMRQHWRAQQRVKALKVAIQLAKLLADASQMKLYARKFKLITNSLDEFGALVRQRIHSIANANANDQHQRTQSQSHLPNHDGQPQMSANEHEAGKEICRNWFLKVASIRELVPRFYVELAILKSCDILFQRISPRALAHSLEEQFYAQTLRRLSASAWGMGQPIVALHARAYLCRLAERLIGWRGLTRESLLFELLFANLKSGAQLIGHLDGSRAVLAHHHHHHHQQQQQQQQLLLHSGPSTLNSPTTTTTTTTTTTDTTTSPAQQQDLSLYFDLITGPMQSILNLVTMRCDEYAEDRDFIENAHKRLGRWAGELLDDAQEQLQHHQPADAFCSAPFRRNALLQSLFRALPGDIVAAMAESFNEKLVGGQRAWLRQIAAHPARKGNRSPGHTFAEALLIPSSYATLCSFIIALDASDAFEAAAPLQLKGFILDSAEGLANELHEREHNGLSLAHMRCLKALVSFANHHQEARLDPLLEQLLARLKRSRHYVQHYAFILDTIKTLLTNRTRLDELKRLSCSRPFCKLFELLRKDEHKLEAARWILETIRANLKLNHKLEPATISDPLLVSFLLRLFEMLNDSLSPLAANEDICHLSQLVVFFIDRFELNWPAERLELWSQVRKCASNLNLVLEHLIRRALQLDPQHRKLERRRTVRQNFLNGCLAFVLVTTPALAEPHVQLELYQLACQQALEHASLSLADYFVRQIVLTLWDSLAADSLISSLGKRNKGLPAQQQQSNSPQLTQINQDGAGARAEAEVPRAAPNALLAAKLEPILRMLIKHQEHVDLKHKLALHELLHECPIFEGRAELLQMSSRLTGPAAHFESNEGFNNNAAGGGAGAGSRSSGQRQQSSCLVTGAAPEMI